MSFVQENIDRMRALIGETIAHTQVIEMALCGPEDAPIFRRPDVPFVQAYCVEFKLKSGKLICFSTYQNDDNWGIRADETRESVIEKTLDGLCGNIGRNCNFRRAPDVDFPLGVLSNVEVALDDLDDIAEIVLTIGNSNIFLKAGEVYEGLGDRLIIHEGDESILIFLNAEDRLSAVFE